MKFKKNIFLVGILLLLISNNIIAQRNHIIRAGEETGGEYLSGNGGQIFDDLSKSKSKISVDEVIEDIRFGYNINDALYSQNLIIKAMKAEQDEWFNRQYNLLEEEIEKQLDDEFPDFPEAQKAFFKNLEKENVFKNNYKVNEKYSDKIKIKENTSKEIIKDFKLLEFRGNELRNGILNTQYEYLQYQGIPLNQITDLNQIVSFKNNIISNLKNNEWLLFNDRKTYSYLINEITRTELNNNLNHPILIALLNEQLKSYKNFYIPSLNTYMDRTKWEQLNLMQAFLNKVRFSMSLENGTSYMYDFGNEKFIEDFALRNRSTIRSVFDSYYDMYGPFYNLWLAREDRQEAISQVNAKLEQRENEINNLLNSVNLKKWFLDSDNDGYHAKGSSPKLETSSPGTGWREGVSKGEDCDDNNKKVHESNKIFGDIKIYDSPLKPSKGNNGIDIARDYLHGDLNESDVFELIEKNIDGLFFKYNAKVAFKRTLKETNDDLFEEMEKAARLVLIRQKIKGNMSNNTFAENQFSTQEMINRFRENLNGINEVSENTKKLLSQDTSYQIYLQEIKSQLEQIIQNTDVENIKNIKLNIENDKLPRFSDGGNQFTWNSSWSMSISLESMNLICAEFNYNIIIDVYDHFGLDIGDMFTSPQSSNARLIQGMWSWFTLQRVTRPGKQNIKPFINYVRLENQNKIIIK